MPDPCQELIDTVDSLYKEKNGLAEQLHEAVGSGKAAIVDRINEVRERIAKAEKRLEACFVSTTPPKPRPLTITLTELKCHRDTSGFGSDEPYVIACSVNRRPLPLLPQILAVRSDPQSDISSGDSRAINLQVWGVTQSQGVLQPLVIASPDDAIIFVALLENDSSNPSTILALARGALFAGTLSSANNGDDRQAMVKLLDQDLRGAIAAGCAAGQPDPDEVIGFQELRLDAAMLRDVALNTSASFVMLFAGEGAVYTLRVVIAG